jgi:hypothetical protein
MIIHGTIEFVHKKGPSLWLDWDDELYLPFFNLKSMCGASLFLFLFEETSSLKKGILWV